jgi:hypothetical protein
VAADEPRSQSRDPGGPSARDTFAIVGVGASAGGLEALEQLFGALPADSGMAFVVIQHLDPTRQSHMVELLSRRTKMSVVAVKEGAKVQPNCVYMILPNREVTIQNGVLHLAEPSESRAARRPIDTFFVSLADDRREYAVGVILSGTGSNGSSGIRVIKEFGGITIAQAPETAAHPGMPRNAIATGMVDAVLPPEGIAEALVRYARHLPLELARQENTGPAEQTASIFGRILAFLQGRTGQDFRLYKKNTLTRRMYRRLGSARAQWARRLREAPAERCRGGQGSGQGPDDQRHRFLPGSGGLGGPDRAGDRAAGAWAGGRRGDPGMGSRLRVRRGGLHDRDADRRAGGSRAKELRRQDLRDRQRR